MIFQPWPCQSNTAIVRAAAGAVRPSLALAASSASDRPPAGYVASLHDRAHLLTAHVRFVAMVAGAAADAVRDGGDEDEVAEAVMRAGRIEESASAAHAAALDAEFAELAWGFDVVAEREESI